MNKIFNTLFSGIPTLADKVRILKLKYSLSNYSLECDTSKDVHTFIFLKEYGFSEQIISNFFKPFFAGVFLEKSFRHLQSFLNMYFQSLIKV